MTENKCESCEHYSPTEACLVGHTESYDKSGCNDYNPSQYERKRLFLQGLSELTEKHGIETYSAYGMGVVLYDQDKNEVADKVVYNEETRKYEEV